MTDAVFPSRNISALLGNINFQESYGLILPLGAGPAILNGRVIIGGTDETENVATTRINLSTFTIMVEYEHAALGLGGTLISMRPVWRRFPPLPGEGGEPQSKTYLSPVITEIMRSPESPKWMSTNRNFKSLLYSAFQYMPNMSFFFWSGLQGPNAYSLWYGVVPKPSIGEGYL